jgi:hypothetical protein
MVGSPSKNELRRKLLGYGAKAVRVGSELADVLVHVTTKPSLLTGLSVAARAINAFGDVTTTTPESYFSSWPHFRSIGTLSEFVLEHLMRHDLVKDAPNARVKAGRILLAEVHGHRIGWVQQDMWTQGPWIPDGQSAETTMAAIGRFLWESLGNALIARKSLMGRDYLEPDPLHKVHESKDAVVLFESLQPFLRKGHPRSVLLHGEPGTGKSHVMKHVSRLAGGLSLRVKARDLDRLDSIGNIIQLLCPNAVLIDDLDRIDRPEAILSEIEVVRGTCGLLMVSVNRLAGLDPAVLRPKRFDEVIHLESLDPEVIDTLIGPDVPPDIRSCLRVLPVAYIGEFHLRCEVLGMEAALKSVTSLVERNELVRNMCLGEDEVSPTKPCISKPPS